MSEFPYGSQPGDGNDWREMMRSILGDQAADEVIRALEESGIDPSTDFNAIAQGKNFTFVSQQIQQMLGSTGDGPVNWKMAEQVARESITRDHFDRVTGAEGDGARGALRTASLWLDVATDFNPPTAPSLAWSRLDWVAHSLATFRRLLEPVGANISRAFSESFAQQLEHMPPELRGAFGDPSNFMANLMATMIGVQYGSALAELAVSSFGSSDTGLPLTEGSTTALVPSNIAEFAKELEIPEQEVQLFIAVREAAAARLYSSVPWLRSRILDTVSAFAAQIQIDTDSIEEQLRSSMEDMESLGALNLTGIFELELSEDQQELLDRLELLLSLVEGWVTEVSRVTVAPHLAHAVALAEMFTRRYATDHPAKHVWETQLGMELAPRLLRDAAHFWQLARIRLGQSEADKLWTHPDFLPTAEHLRDPETFFAAPTPSDVEAELDSFLEDLLSGSDGEGDGSPSGEAPHEPKFGD